MISDGVVTHGSPESYLTTLQFTNPTVSAALVATLTTVLAYQASATIFDLCLGLKPAGATSVSDLFILHFSEQASITAMIPDLFSSRTIAGFMPHGRRERARAGTRRGSFSVTVAARLLLLLLSVPIINLLSIILSLESDRSLTFGAAKFGGVALGVPAKDSAAKWFAANGICRQFDTAFGEGVTDTPDFFVCADFFMPTDNLSDTTIVLRLKQAPSFIQMEMISRKLNYSVTVTAPVRIGEKLFRLRQIFPEKDFRQLVDITGRTLRETCVSEQLDSNDLVQERERNWLSLSQTVQCKFISFLDIVRFMSIFRDVFGLVDADKFEVARTAEGDEFMNGDGLLLLKRRRPYIGLISLFAATAGVALIRILVKSVTCNDVEIAVEMIVKRGLGICGFDSMLQCREFVRYCQVGDHGDEELWPDARQDDGTR